MVASTYTHPERMSIIKAQQQKRVLMLRNLSPAIGPVKPSGQLLRRATADGWMHPLVRIALQRVWKLILGELEKRALVPGRRDRHSGAGIALVAVVYCYRHYIEVALKEIVEDHGQWVGITLPKKDHNLRELWKLFLEIAVAYHNDPSDEAAVAVSDCIDEFAQVDPGSFAFRYARDKVIAHRGCAALLALIATACRIKNLDSITVEPILATW